MLPMVRMAIQVLPPVTAWGPSTNVGSGITRAAVHPVVFIALSVRRPRSVAFCDGVVTNGLSCSARTARRGRAFAGYTPGACRRA